MNKTLLVTRPKYDDTTHYLFHWASVVLDQAREKGFKVLDLNKKRANRKDFLSVLRKQTPSLVFLNGHGNADSITGHDGESLIDANGDMNLLEKKIIYALSCQSAQGLGQAAINNRAEAYIGYDEDFIFFYDPTKISEPLKDKVAALFFEPSNQIISPLLKGRSVGEAHIRSKSEFIRSIHEVLTNESSDTSLAPYLLWDLRHQVSLGNQEATI